MRGSETQMTSDSPKTYVVRLSGTISTKSPRTRRRFNDRLAHNIRAALDREGVDYDLRDEWSRMFVETTADVGDRLRRIFGVQGVRPSVAVPWDDLDDIVREGRQRYAERVEGRTFGVFSRRVGQRDRFPCDSVDINRELGGALDEAGGRVDLDDPEIEVRLEAHHDRVYFFDEELDGPGGLPLGTEGRALALVSGGFDSVVAAWQMMRRGVALDFVFFNLAGPPHERGLREVLAELDRRWIAGDDPAIEIVDFRPVLADLKSNIPGEYWQVVLKRLMYESAARIAADRDVSALVTGESIGQVSSQTLPNLAAIEGPIEPPVLRPLVGQNKEDIVARAREIGVHDVAEKVPEFCGLAGGNPVTSTTAERIDDRRAAIAPELVEELTDDRRTQSLREFVSDDSRGESVQLEELPPESALLDLRDEEDYEDWHPEGAMHVPFETAAEQFMMLPEEPTWVLYCEVGLKSAFVAEKMRAAGFEAYSFRGGVPRLRRRLEDRNAGPAETQAHR